MFGIKIKDDYLVIDNAHTFSFVKNNPLFDIDVPSGEYSYPITIYLSPENRKVLGQLTKLAAVKDWGEVDVETYFNGLPWERGKLKPLRGTNTKVELNIKSGTSVLSNLLKSIKINEVDYGTVDMLNGYATPYAHMKDTITNPIAHNHIFAPVYNEDFFSNPNAAASGPSTTPYLKFMNYYNVDALQFQEVWERSPYANAIVAFPYLTTIIKGIFNFIGWNLEWDLMQNATFKKIAIVNNRNLAHDILVDKLYVGKNLEQIAPNYIGEAYVEIIQELDGASGNVITTVKRKAVYWDLSLPLYIDPTLSIPHEARILFDLDALPIYNNPLSFYDTVNHFYYTTQQGKVHHVNMLLEYEEHPTSAYVNQPNLRHVVEIFEDGVILATWELASTYAQFQTLNVVLDYTPTKFGSKITFFYRYFYPNISGTYNLQWNTCSALIYSGNLTIEIEEADPFPELITEINYAKHLNNDTCSEFLNNIRTRFGAYIANVDYSSRTLTFKQLNDTLTLPAKSICKSRAVDYEIEFSENSYTFEEDFGSDALATQEEYMLQFPAASIGDVLNEEIDNKIVTLKYAPIFTKQINYINGFTAIYGAIKLAGNNYSADFVPEMRLGFNNGLHPWANLSVAANYPLITGKNINSKGLSTGLDFILKLDDAIGLIPEFLNAWYSKLLQQEVYKMSLFMSFSELKAFNYDQVDFYLNQKFLIKKLDIQLSGSRVLPVKAEMVRFT